MNCLKKNSKTKIIPKTKFLKCLICDTSKKIQEFRCDNCFTDAGKKAWYICRDCNINLTEKGLNCPICRGVENVNDNIINHYSKAEKCMFCLHEKLHDFKNKFINSCNKVNKQNNNNDEKESCCHFSNIFICTGIIKIFLMIFAFSLILHTICMKNMTLNNICYICYINTLVFIIYCFCQVYLFLKKVNECVVIIISLVGTLCVITSFATVYDCKIDPSTYLLVIIIFPSLLKLNYCLNKI